MKPVCSGVLICIACWCVIGNGRAGPQAAEQFTCRSPSSTRLISIYRAADDADLGRCRVDYTKDGSTKTVWSANRNYAYCVKQALRLVTRLSSSNYSCTPSTLEPSDGAQPKGAAR
jgi:hypothetical protein